MLSCSRTSAPRSRPSPTCWAASPSSRLGGSSTSRWWPTPATATRIPTIVFDPTDEAARKRAALAFTEIMALAISLGGTITGEHGIGRLKKELLPTQLGERVMGLHHQIKHVFDPDGILNPGAILD